MEWRLVSKIAALVVAFPTTAVLFYWLFLRKDTDEEEEEEGGSRRLGTGDKGTKSSRQTVIHLPVPSKDVGWVIGQKGANIRKIQEESGARLSFISRDQEMDRSDNKDRIICIRGDSESAQKAEVIIRQIIADRPAIITEEILVPVYCLGRLIGKEGERIRQTSRSSRCKIFINRQQDTQELEAHRVVSITGTSQDVQLAKAMIEEQVNEEEQFRATVVMKGANREQRKGGGKRGEEEIKERKPLTSRVVNATDEASWDAGDQRRDGMMAEPGAQPVREFMEVFVSAVEHPGHFWLQMVNRESLNLDTLTNEMSQFYSSTDSNQKYKSTEVREGDIVAAPFSADSLWYRARVEGLKDGKADLYYFDFGDNEMIPVESLRELKPEYLSLPVQAIECALANVKPTGDVWSEESCEVFEELTHCADWKILSARTKGYLSLPSGQRPCVQLVNSDTPQTIDVAAELVARGLAMWDYPPTPSALTDTATTTTTTATAAAADTVRPELVPDPNSS